MYLLSDLNTSSLYAKNFYPLINILIFINNNVYIYIKEKFWLHIVGFSSSMLPKVFNSGKSYILISGQSTNKLTIQIIYISIAKNISSYIYMFKYKTIDLIIYKTMLI